MKTKLSFLIILALFITGDLALAQQKSDRIDQKGTQETYPDVGQIVESDYATYIEGARQAVDSRSFESLRYTVMQVINAGMDAENSGFDRSFTNPQFPTYYKCEVAHLIIDAYSDEAMIPQNALIELEKLIKAEKLIDDKKMTQSQAYNRIKLDIDLANKMTNFLVTYLDSGNVKYCTIHDQPNSESIQHELIYILGLITVEKVKLNKLNIEAKKLKKEIDVTR
jgi:hypothetical protein